MGVHFTMKSRVLYSNFHGSKDGWSPHTTAPVGSRTQAGVAMIILGQESRVMIAPRDQELQVRRDCSASSRSSTTTEGEGVCVDSSR